VPTRFSPRRGAVNRKVENNSCYCNYVCYLRIMRNMFCCLTVVDGLVMACGLRVELLAAGVVRGWLSICQQVPWNHAPEDDKIPEVSVTYAAVVIMLICSAMNGCIALFFTKLFQNSLTSAVPDDLDARQLDRTLWLQWLPVEDAKRRRRFQLTDDDFEQVSSDLKNAFEEALREQEACLSGVRRRVSVAASMDPHVPSPIDRVYVSPVVDDISDLSFKLRAAREKRTSYKEHLRHAVPFMKCWYRSQIRSQERAIVRHKGQLLEKMLSRKRLSGSAFITFRTTVERNRVMALDNTRCLGINMQRITGFFYFTFGRPPFSSVTLRCELAPHPDEVIWQNLHIGFWERQIRFWTLSCLVLVGLAAGVTPAITNGISNAKNMPIFSTMLAGWETLLLRVKAEVLLVINSLVLPQCLYLIAVAERTMRKSIVEARQLTLNFAFLVLNIAGLPLLDKEAVNKAWKYVWDMLELDTNGGSGHAHRVIHDFLEEMSILYLKSTGLLCVQYLFSAALLSSTVALLAQVWMPLVGKLLSALFSVTPRERRENMEPWPFAWGYFYAWTLSLTAIALWMSPETPGVLPVAATFFTMRARIDQHNLSLGVYSCGSEDSGQLAMKVLGYLRRIVAMFWLFVGCLCFGEPFQMVAPKLAKIAGPVFVTAGVLTLCVNLLETANHRWWSKVMRRLSLEGQDNVGDAGRVVTRMAAALGVSVGRTTVFGEKFKKVSCNWNVNQKKDIIWPDKEVTGLVNLARSEPRFAEKINEQLNRGRGTLNVGMFSPGGRLTGRVSSDLEEMVKSLSIASQATSSSALSFMDSPTGGEGVDFGILDDIEMGEIEGWNRRSSLDSPYNGEYDGNLDAESLSFGEHCPGQSQGERAACASSSMQGERAAGASSSNQKERAAPARSSLPGELPSAARRSIQGERAFTTRSSIP